MFNKDTVHSSKLERTFEVLEEQNIRYVILRGYFSQDEIYNSQDIDIYVHKDDRRKLEELLSGLGWSKRMFSAGRYPHKFYSLMDGRHMFKLDIVFGLYFSSRLYEFKFEKDVFENSRKLQYFMVPAADKAITIFALHVIFDKGHLSPANKKRFMDMWKDLKDSLDEGEDQKEKGYIFLMPLIEKIAAEESLSDDELIEFQQKVKESGILKYSKFRYLFRKLQNAAVRVKNKVSALFQNIFSNNNICVLGVDGAGKTSTIDELNNVLGARTQIQYMGFRDHITRLAKKRLNDKPVKKMSGILSKAVKLTAAYFEMWYRIIIHWTKDYKVIYDRYAWEIYINSRGFVRIVNTVFFKYLFPKPKHIFYLYCPTEESLNRKDDILNKEDFAAMKARFDREYINSRHVISIDTSKNSLEQTLDIIIENLPKDYVKYL